MKTSAHIHRRERRAAWALVAPFAIVTAVFIFYPLYRSIVLAFSQTFGPGATEPAGWLNFRMTLTDPLFWVALRNTALFTLGSLFIQLPLALILASFLNRPDLRGRTVYRLVMFMPQLVGLVFAAMIGGVFFAKRVGAVNQILHATIGLDLDFPWLDQHVTISLILIALWLYVGFNMVYFLAALQTVDRSLVEAARIDGANPAQRFIHVVIPSIRPVLTFVVLLSFIGSMQLFELPYVMLNGAGTENRGLTVVMYLYQQAFVAGDLGMASAVGWLLGLALIAAAALQMLVARKEAA
ncbi:MAG: lactose ABC transporter permease [Phycisphaerae bacterium]|nr:lactose ABC transporter permease [Phycisphaerae bacterium]